MYAAASVYIASQLTLPTPSPISFNPKQIGERVADVVFRAKDNAQLAGWYFRGTSDKAIIMVHGAGAENRANLAYGTPDIAKHYYDKGYTVLLFDLRASGESEKTRVSFGQYEAGDVAGAFKYLVVQEFKPESIGIIANSLGAISTIMASEDVKSAGAIVLDSPASDVKPIISHIMKNERGVPEFLHFGIFLAAKLVYRIDVDRLKPIDKIHTFKSTPILFLHGEKDDLILPENTEALQRKLDSGARITFPNATHIATYKSDPQKYLETLDKFFENNLK